MHDMPFPVDHDVSVMPVLDLEDVTCDRVCCHGLNEIQAGLLEGSGVGTAIFVDEITVKVIDLGPAHLIPGCSIRHDINHTALFEEDKHSGLQVLKMTYTWCGRGDSVGEQVEYEARLHEYVLEHGDDLKREHILAAIVSHFENGRLPDFVLDFLAL
jgi:hypothetical protein